MGFKKHDKQTFIADSAAAFASRRITKREFLRRMGLAGVGFSAFSLGHARQHAAVPQSGPDQPRRTPPCRTTR